MQTLPLAAATPPARLRSVRAVQARAVAPAPSRCRQVRDLTLARRVHMRRRCVTGRFAATRCAHAPYTSPDTGAVVRRSGAFQRHAPGGAAERLAEPYAHRYCGCARGDQPPFGPRFTRRAGACVCVGQRVRAVSLPRPPASSECWPPPQLRVCLRRTRTRRCLLRVRRATLAAT